MHPRSALHASAGLACQGRRGVGEGVAVAGLGQLAAVKQPSGTLAQLGHPQAGRRLPGLPLTIQRVHTSLADQLERKEEYGKATQMYWRRRRRRKLKERLQNGEWGDRT